MLSIGLMSGTSMDGIDAALIRTDGQADIRELDQLSVPYAPEFKLLLHAAQYCVKESEGYLLQAKNNYALFGIRKYLEEELKLLPINRDQKLQELMAYAREFMHIDSLITFDDVIEHSTQLHAQAALQLIEKNGIDKQAIDVVGSHGQTMYHQPNRGISIVLGDGQLLADTLGIAVVNDFRSRDVAAGGQGAPFAPIYHQALAVRDNKVPAVVVNCGGIANMTVIINDNPEDLIGFDTGPGNGLIDRLVRQRTLGKENIDRDGKYGQRGEVNDQILNRLRETSIVKDGLTYYDLPPPKSLDFGDLVLIEELDLLSTEDACATLEAFTAESIVSSLDLLDLPRLPTTWILAGGGWNNPVIKEELENRLRNKIGDDVEVKKANQIGWDNQALEAQIFAFFAVRSLQGKPLSVPGTTGVPEPLSGGQIHIPESGSTEAVIELVHNLREFQRPLTS